MLKRITSPYDDSVLDLCEELRARNDQLETPGAWPAEQLRLCGEAGVFEWFLQPEHGGQGWSPADIYRGYMALSAACLTTTFVITQRMGACRRVAGGESDQARELLPALVRGERFATVGISHLTTSRRHLAKPVLRALEGDDGFILQGQSPWVTGARHADLIVLGAVLDDGREILAAVPGDAEGLSTPSPADLIGLNASWTGAAQCDAVKVPREMILAGPVENVMKTGVGARSGGLHTSVLALGLASACIALIGREAEKRPDLQEPHDTLLSDWRVLEEELLATAEGRGDCQPQDLRARSNSLVLRASQAALTASKGAGYVAGHPAGRWCREALFFLVWSCPQAVMNANLCELAGVES